MVLVAVDAEAEAPGETTIILAVKELAAAVAAAVAAVPGMVLATRLILDKLCLKKELHTALMERWILRNHRLPFKLQ